MTTEQPANDNRNEGTATPMIVGRLNTEHFQLIVLGISSEQKKKKARKRGGEGSWAVFCGVPHRYVGMEAMIRRWRTLSDGQRQKGGSRPAGSRAVGRLGGGEDDFEGPDRAHRASGPCPKKKKAQR